MIGKLVSLIAVVGLAAAASRTWEEFIPFEGIDPSTVSCDPLGLVHLLLPHHSNCSQFYQCVHGQKVERECAPGGAEPLRFDFERQVCNWPSVTACVLLPLESEEGSGDVEELTLFAEEIENGPVDEHLTAEASGTVRPVAALSARQGNNSNALNCNNAVSAPKQAPYKGDCQKYWKCVEGVPQTFYCSDGLFFNESSQQCDHEANVKCSIQITEELDGEFLLYDN